MSQIIEPSLLEEFSGELQKIENARNSNPKLSCSKSPALDKFFNLFLSKEFPKGELNEVIEKNFAIYIHQNAVNIDSVVEKYRAMGWTPKPLLGWLQKVANGELKNFNILELLNWAKKYNSTHFKILEEAKAELSFQCESVPEILAKPKQPENWIVKPFFRPRTISYIASQAGKGKTWLALCVGLSVASGTDFLEKFQSKRAKVLYLDYENFELLHERLRMLIKGFGMNSSSFESFYVHSTMKKFSELKDDLQGAICRLGIELLIIDTFREFAEIDENDSSEVSMLIGELRKLIDETGVAIILLHHEGKMHPKGEPLNKLRGSTALSGCADCVIQLNRDAEFLIVNHTKSRGARNLNPFILSISSTEGESFTLKYAGDALELDSSKGVAFFNAWAKDNNILSFASSEFINLAVLAGISRSTAKRTLAQLAQAGKIRKESDKARAKWEIFFEESPCEVHNEL